jgi:hypothetical protein
MLHNPPFSISTNMETIPIPGAEVYYEKNSLSPEETTTLVNVLKTKCARERRRSSFGYVVPRDEVYYGDPEKSDKGGPSCISNWSSMEQPRARQTTRIGA